MNRPVFYAKIEGVTALLNMAHRNAKADVHASPTPIRMDKVFCGA